MYKKNICGYGVNNILGKVCKKCEHICIYCYGFHNKDGKKAKVCSICYDIYNKRNCLICKYGLDDEIRIGYYCRYCVLKENYKEGCPYIGSIL